MKMPVRSNWTWKPTYTCVDRHRRDTAVDARLVLTTPSTRRGFMKTPSSQQRQVQVDFGAESHVRAVDRRAPPQRKPSIGNLVETAPLRVRELLVLHGLLEARRLLPEEALPRREVRALEERVLEDALDAS